MSQEQNKTISGSVYDVYTEDSQEYKENSMPRVGQTVEFEDGRKFVFASTAINIGQAGVLLAAPVSLDGLAYVDHNAGDRKVKVVVDSATVANQFADGILSDPIHGIAYKIKSNTNAFSENATYTSVFTLYDPLVRNIDGSDPVFYRPLRASFVRLCEIAGDAIGVSLAQVVGSSTNTAFLWLQYQGPGMGSVSGVALGDAVAATLSGQVTVAAAGDNILGQIISSVSEQWAEVNWHIAGGC